MRMIGNYLIDDFPVMLQLYRRGPNASRWMGVARSNKLEGRIYLVVPETCK